MLQDSNTLGREPVEEGQFDDAVSDLGLINHELLFNSQLHDLKERMEEFYFDYTKNKDQEQLPQDSDDDEEDYDEGADDDEGYGHRGPNSQLHSNNSNSVRPKKTEQELSKKFVGKINVEKYDADDGLLGSNRIVGEAGNKLIQSNKKSTANRQKVKDKQDRATVEQVMDPRTRMILYKFLSSEKLASIDGCISTGKEANVYHGTGGSNESYAIKIFKTSILTFKARDKYVSGEFRFRHGYCKTNPRKMVRVWAEKEYRNLLRIHGSGSGIRVPQPKWLKSHVIVMEFIGEAGWPSPLLKDVKFDKLELEQQSDQLSSTDLKEPTDRDPVQELLNKLYRDALLILYKLYKICKLVHADFSEFNLILRDTRDLVVIDVSQSVEHDHPRSFDFLRSDIKNVQDFFGKRHVKIGNFKEIFNWITSPTVDQSNFESELETILRNGKYLGSPGEDGELDMVDQEVFRQVYIPKKMVEIDNYERDYAKVKSGTNGPGSESKSEGLVYANQMGMKPDFSGPKEAEAPADSGSQTGESDDSDSGDDADEGSKFHNSHRPKNETAEEKRERKKVVKEQKAEKRQSKIPKHVKKRKEKMSHANSKK